MPLTSGETLSLIPVWEKLFGKNIWRGGFWEKKGGQKSGRILIFHIQAALSIAGERASERVEAILVSQ